MTWATAPLGEVVSVVSGATPKTSEKRYWNGNVLWVTPKDLSDLEGDAYIHSTPRSITDEGLRSCAASLLPRNSVLLSSRAPIGLVAINSEPMATNQGFKSLVPHRDKVDSNFLYNWLKSKTAYLQGLGNGATFKEVSKAIVERIEIPLPPLHEQRRIAAILDKADVLRRKRKRALDLLDSLTQSIFLEMFGDPVANPKGWDLKAIGDLNVAMTYGPRFYNEEYSEHGIRIVRITDLSDSGELDFQAMPKLAMGEAEIETYRSRPGELLFARTGATVGKLALVSGSDPATIPGAYFIRLRFPNFIEPFFAWVTLRCRSIQQIIFEGSRQSAQQNFSGPGLRRLPFILPPLEDQRFFIQRAKNVIEMKQRIRDQVSLSNALFSSLQSRAFSGQL